MFMPFVFWALTYGIGLGILASALHLIPALRTVTSRRTIIDRTARSATATILGALVLYLLALLMRELDTTGSSLIEVGRLYPYWQIGSVVIISVVIVAWLLIAAHADHRLRTAHQTHEVTS